MRIFIVSVYKKGWSQTALYAIVAEDSEEVIRRLKEKFYGDLKDHQVSFQNIEGDDSYDIVEIVYM